MFARFALRKAALLGGLLALPLPAPTHEPTLRHPADGPDIDVRVLVGSEAVTFTLLMNLAFVDEVVDTVREDDDLLHPAEFEAHQLDLRDHFRATNKITIDGVVVTPVIKSFEAGSPDLTLLPLFPRMGAKALAKVQLVLTYPTKAPPRTVSMVWGKFPDDLALETEAGTPPMQVVAQVTARGLRTRVVFTTKEPEFTWHDTGESIADRFEVVPDAGAKTTIAVPMVSAGMWGLALLGILVGLYRGGFRRRPWLAFVVPALLLGGGLTTQAARVEVENPFDGSNMPTEAEAVAVFQPLHANIYRAFDYVDESDIYDALARSVHGDLLDNLYNEVYRSLIMQEEGGAVSQIEAVRPLSTEVETVGALPPDDTPGFTVKARWQVDGAVAHWGHSHRRTNEYEARYTVARTDDGWRIRGHEILAQLTVSTSTTDPRGSGAPGAADPADSGK